MDRSCTASSDLPSAHPVVKESRRRLLFFFSPRNFYPSIIRLCFVGWISCVVAAHLLQGSGSRPHGQWRPRRRARFGGGTGWCTCAPGTTSPSCTRCDVVKPSNVLLDTVDWETRVSDFGTASMLGLGVRLTDARRGAVGGVPGHRVGHMAPGQAQALALFPSGGHISANFLTKFLATDTRGRRDLEGPRRPGRPRHVRRSRRRNALMESQSLPDVVRRDRPDVDSVLSSFNLAEDDGARSVGGGGRPLVKPRENENPPAAGRSICWSGTRTDAKKMA